MSYDQYDLEREAYAEEMFERRANGIEVISFEEWKRRKETLSRIFAKLDERWNRSRSNG